MHNRIPLSTHSFQRRLILLALVGITSLTFHCLAQDKYDPEKDQGLQAVAEAQKKAQPKLGQVIASGDSVISANNALNQKLIDSAITSGGWDNTKCRFVSVANYHFQMDNNEMEEYFRLRQLAAFGAMVTAQRALAEWMGTKAEMSVSVNNPGDPFKLENDQKLESIKRRLKEAKQKAEKLGARFDKSEEAAFKGVTSSDRI